MDNDSNSFQQFMKLRQKVAQAFVNGDASPLGRIVTRVSPATFFGPKGGSVQGADRVYSIYEGDAEHFDSGQSNFEILQMGVSDGIAYWVGFQRVAAQLGGKTDAVLLNLRVTEVFRRESGEWKLVHRHADELKAEADHV